MSRSFLGFGQIAYIGQPYTRPVKYKNISGSVVPLQFQWISYGASSLKPNINVLVDLQAAFNVKALDQIRSIYIDNLGSSNPVYIYFPDTGETLSAKANSEGWYPAFTNEKKIWVIGEGFLTGSIPQTFILVTNLPIEAAVNTELDQSAALWLASPVITRGSSIYNTALGIPALGDQLFSSGTFSLINAGLTVPLWGTPYSNGFLYITNLIFNIVELQNNSVTSSGQIVIESTGVAGTLISPGYVSYAQGAFTAYPPLPGVISLQGQIKLDATQTWRARVVTGVNHGTAQILSSFTQQ